ncbi:uncharacterized protein LOC130715102 isoform X2 [Lotus japonicus]|uniref:uncharacterized protein LOC130715102 isoform X2 n=1 Tax=Lotus japonicus TaxID=34305 RepID=UPI00258D982B|nr:uncharacterized protein LOC130715102 isoform X2 [Lotus japonicus]
MVNLVAAQRPLIHGLMKMAGIRPYMVEIEPGTVMSFWVPSETISKPKKKHEKPKLIAKPNKPIVVMVHGFAAEGIVTWQFQVGALTKKYVGALTKKYAVYIPDLLFFGGSTTDKEDRSPRFQAECFAAALTKLGVEKCVVVGFSYGGTVAFEMAEMYPELVQAMVIFGSILTMPDPISTGSVTQLGFSSSKELLLPVSVKGLMALLSVTTHRKLWFPNRLYKDFLEVMFTHRKERGELLEMVSNKDINNIPKFPQGIHLLWGENDQIFKRELAKNMKEQLGDGATFQGIKKAGHLVHLERPCVYNRCLKRFIASFFASNCEAKI